MLGDLTGDGVVNTADITYLNRIVNGNVELATGNIKDKLTILSASIQNKGNITTADSETLLNYIDCMSSRALCHSERNAVHMGSPQNNFFVGYKDKSQTLCIEQASIQNKGNITTADSETLLNYIGGIADLTKYF